MSLQKTDIQRITAITNDISKLQEFIDSLTSQKDVRIKKLYIVNENGYQIELTGNFSNEASAKLLNIIIDSREHLIERLNDVLAQCYSLVQLDEKPLDLMLIKPQISQV
jgi:hypothetical protein